MKKLKTLIILLTLLVALILIYLVASPMWSEQEGGETTPAAEEHTVAVIDHNTLKGFELTKTGEDSSETLTFSLKEDLTGWTWSENGEVPLDNSAFATVVTALTSATSGYKLEDVSAEDLAMYGLDSPAYTLKLAFEDGSEKTYKVGNLNSFNSLYYFSEAGAPNTVYMVDASVPNALELEIYDFVLEETPPVITAAKILSLTYMSENDMVKDFTYFPAGNASDYTDKYNWYYSIYSMHQSAIPAQLPLNGNVAESLTDIITDLSFEECVGFDRTEAKYGFSPSRKVIVKYNVDEGENGVLTEKEYVIYIGAQTEDGGIYAHTADSKLVYILADSDAWVTPINGDHKDLDAAELWLPNYELIEKLTFKSGENTLAVDVNNAEGKIAYSSGDIDPEKLSKLMAALDAVMSVSHTTVLEENTSLEKKVYFELRIKPKDSEKIYTMTVESYTESYCRVTFANNGGRLITAEDAEKLASLISELTAKAE